MTGGSSHQQEKLSRRSILLSVVVCGVLLVGCLTSWSQVQAGACCMSSTVGGVGRLRLWENPKWILGMSLRMLWEDYIRQDEKILADSFRVDAGIGLQVSWLFHDHWTLVASFDTGIFVNFLGHNQPGRISGSLGLRYAYF